MSRKKKIMTGSFNVRKGDAFTYQIPDPNPWKKLWRFITFRSPPVQTLQAEVVKVLDETTFAFKNGSPK